MAGRLTKYLISSANLKKKQFYNIQYLVESNESYKYSHSHIRLYHVKYSTIQLLGLRSKHVNFTRSQLNVDAKQRGDNAHPD